MFMLQYLCNRTLAPSFWDEHASDETQSGCSSNEKPLKLLVNKEAAQEQVPHPRRLAWVVLLARVFAVDVLQGDDMTVVVLKVET